MAIYELNFYGVPVSLRKQALTSSATDLYGGPSGEGACTFPNATQSSNFRWETGEFNVDSEVVASLWQDTLVFTTISDIILAASLN